MRKHYRAPEAATTARRQRSDRSANDKQRHGGIGAKHSLGRGERHDRRLVEFADPADDRRLLALAAAVAATARKRSNKA